MPSKPAVEHRQRVLHHLIQIGGHGLRGREARELREFVHQRAHGFHFARDGGGAFPQDAPRVGGAVSERGPSWRADAVGAKRDGRERILDLVRHAARHFVPGRGLLGAQQFAGVFHHQYESGAALLIERGHGERQMQHAPLGFVFNLRAGHAGAARAIHQVADLGGVVAGEQIAQARRPRHLLLGENPHQRAIHALDAAIGGERDNAGRDAFENRLGEAAAGFQLLAVGFQRLRHFVERLYQRGHLVDRADVHAISQIAFSNLLGGFEQRGDGRADLSGHVARDPGGEEKNEQRNQRQQQQVQAAEGFAVDGQPVIFGDVTSKSRPVWRPDSRACARKE